MKPAKTKLPLLYLFAASAVLTAAAGLMLFSTFMFYDDEGYVLISLRNFAAHGHLYGDVYTQYGPFPFAFYYWLNLLGLPLNHVAERSVTLLAWSGCATLAAWLTWRATRNSVAMLAVLAATFVYLWIMVSEPSHPGGLIAITTAIMAAVGGHRLAAGRWSNWAALAGAGGAVLLLTKINVGGFAVLSACALLLLYSENDRVRRWAPWLLALGSFILPCLLMRPLLGLPWVQTFAFVFALSGVTATGAAARGAAPEAGARAWRAALIAGSIVMVVVLGTILARGTTLGELVQGTLLGPLHHPSRFSLEFRWAPGAAVVAAVSFALFFFARFKARGPRAETVASLVAALRVLAAGGLAWMIWGFPAVSADNVVFAFSAPCVWLFLWPLPGTPRPAVRAQAWLGLLFLGQWLHVYPVPGSQIAWGSFLSIPLTTVGAWEALVWLRQTHAAERRWTRFASFALQGGLLALAGITGVRLANIGERYFDSRPLNLPGARILRIPDAPTALFRLLIFNAQAHGDMLFSLPGMFSMNIWSGLPTPTLSNVTHWFSLLDDAQQRAIVASLAAHPNACIIVQTEHLHFLRTHNLAPTGPLYDYVMSEFVPAFAFDGFEFRVRRGRQIVPLLTAEVFEQKPVPPGAPAATFDTLITLNLLLPPDQQIGSIEINTATDWSHPPIKFPGSAFRAEVTPIDLAGKPRLPTQERAFPFALRGPAMVSLYFNREGRRFSNLETLLIVRDVTGAEMALVRLRP